MKIRSIVTIFIIFSFLTMGIVAASDETDLNKCIEFNKHHRNWRTIERSLSANFETDNEFLVCKIVSKDKIYLKDLKTGKQITTNYDQMINSEYEYHVFSYKKEFYDNSGELDNNLKEYIECNVKPFNDENKKSEKNKQKIDHLAKCHIK